MSSLQVQARALGDPTRHEIFRYLVDAGTDVDVAELTDHVGLNHNAVRQHLAKLVDADLVEEARARPLGVVGRDCCTGWHRLRRAVGGSLAPTNVSRSCSPRSCGPATRLKRSVPVRAVA